MAGVVTAFAGVKGPLLQLKVTPAAGVGVAVNVSVVVVQVSITGTFRLTAGGVTF